jgi:hypothetical protein
MHHWWNESDRGKPKYWEKKISQRNFVQHKSHMDWPGFETGPPRSETGARPPAIWHGLNKDLISETEEKMVVAVNIITGGERNWKRL